MRTDALCETLAESGQLQGPKACPQHGGVLNWICQTCSDGDGCGVTRICLDCMKDGHAEHTHEILRIAGDRMRTELAKSITQADAALVTAARNAKAAQVVSEKIDEEHSRRDEQIEKRLAKVRAELNEKLNSLEAECMAEVNRQAEANRMKAAELVDELGMSQSKLQTAKEDAQKLVKLPRNADDEVLANARKCLDTLQAATAASAAAGQLVVDPQISVSLKKVDELLKEVRELVRAFASFGSAGGPLTVRSLGRGGSRAERAARTEGEAAGASTTETMPASGSKSESDSGPVWTCVENSKRGACTDCHKNKLLNWSLHDRLVCDRCHSYQRDNHRPSFR